MGMSTHDILTQMCLDEKAAAKDRIAELEAENTRLREAMPVPDQLRTLADWFDADDERKGCRGSQIQRMLRHWADAIEKALEATT